MQPAEAAYTDRQENPLLRGREPEERERGSSLDSHSPEAGCIEASSVPRKTIQTRVRFTGKRLRANQPSDVGLGAMGEAVLHALHPLSSDRHKGKITEISRNGMGILTSQCMFPGTLVQVRIGKKIEMGEVRQCVERGRLGYWIGVLFNLAS